jgi:hypothetical protein
VENENRWSRLSYVEVLQAFLTAGHKDLERGLSSSGTCELVILWGFLISSQQIPLKTTIPLNAAASQAVCPDADPRRRKAWGRRTLRRRKRRRDLAVAAVAAVAVGLCYY